MSDTKHTQSLFVGDDCILQDHMTSSSLFFDFGDHPPAVTIQEEMCKRWNTHPALLAVLGHSVAALRECAEIMDREGRPQIAVAIRGHADDYAQALATARA